MPQWCSFVPLVGGAAYLRFIRTFFVPSSLIARCVSVGVSRGAAEDRPTCFGLLGDGSQWIRFAWDNLYFSATPLAATDLRGFLLGTHRVGARAVNRSGRG